MLDELDIGKDVNSMDKEFLQQFYMVTSDADWRLETLNDTYLLLNKENGLSFNLDLRVGNYSHRNKNTAKEPLLNAIKIKGKLPKSVIDTTPGVLKDSFLMASRGIDIVAIERNPIVYIMQKKASSVMPVELSLKVIFADSVTELPKHNSELIYIDPMYPAKKKSALVKKDMRILKEIVGADMDAAKLLEAALKTNSRVVIKRPNYAGNLTDKAPSFTSQTGSTRFDIYL